MTAGRARSGGLGWAVLCSLLLATLLSLPTVALASPSATPGATATAPGTWAYGAEKTVSASGASRNGTFALTAHFGYQVLVEEGVAATGVVSLTAQRTMGASFVITYCLPTCQRPAATASLSYHGFEVVHGFANFTQNGSVRVGNSSVPALGLLDSESRVSAGAFENDSAGVRGLLATRTMSAHLSTTLSAEVSVNFTPSLGLLPRAPTPGEQWSSSSAYSGSARWAAAFNYGKHAFNGSSVQRSGGRPGSLPLSGTVSLSGTDLGSLSLSNVSSSQRVGLLVSGPFRLREGFLVIPTAVDLFGGGSVQGAPTGNGSVGSNFSALDYAGSSGGAPLGFASSSAFFNTATTNPEEPTASTTTPSTSALQPEVESSGPVILQAQPESPSVVPHANACLLSGSCSTSAGSSPASLRGGVLLVLAVVVVAALIGGVMVTRRPKVPERANAELYPPIGATQRTQPSGSKPTVAPAKGSESEDPLGHLW